jgi:hypothetical protein
MTDIVKVNASEFGLEESKAKQISDQFKPMLDKMEELESQFNEVMAMEMGPEKVKASKELRLQYVKVRTGTAAIHKEQKAFYWAGGKYVDGWKHAQAFASQGIEGKLADIENQEAKLEAQRIEDLRVIRWDALSAYMEQEPSMLGVMQQDVFDNLFIGAESAHKAKIEAEKKAEQERIANEKKEAAEREAQRLENIRLKEEAEKREAAIAKERKEREAREAILAKELYAKRKEVEDKAQKEREESEAKLKVERDAREKAEAEIRKQKEADEAARKKAVAEAKKLANAPVKNQLKNWVFELELPILSMKNFTTEDEELSTEIAEKFEAFKKWAIKQIENK